MKRFYTIIILLCLFILVLLSSPAAAQKPWQQITVPAVREAADTFTNPPMEYRAVNWAIWGGPQNKENIISDINNINARGGGVYMINNSKTWFFSLFRCFSMRGDGGSPISVKFSHGTPHRSMFSAYVGFIFSLLIDKRQKWYGITHGE